MKTLGLTLCILLLAGCSSDALPTGEDLGGQWVEVTARLDTISFDRLETSEIFRLNRGVEVQDGVAIPKFRSGMYLYSVEPNAIALKWLLSSNSEFEEYYFSLRGGRMSVGNFYNAPYGDRLVFVKLD